MTDLSSHHTAPSTQSGGPNPGILAAVSLGLTIGALLGSAILTNGQTYVSPFSPAGQVAAYFHGNPDAVRLASLFQFGSAVPLGIFAATVYARQLRLGVRVPGPAIGFFGGITASVFLMVSAAVGWVLSRPEITTDVTLTHAMSFLAFITGGVAYVVGLGLLVASRVRTIEGASGLANLVLLPMWVGSGVFFSAERFPKAVQPVIHALPLTAVNDALRAVMLEGQGFSGIAGELAIVVAWGVASFILALSLFRWK